MPAWRCQAPFISGGNGDDAPRIILLGVDNAFDLANDIVFI